MSGVLSLPVGLTTWSLVVPEEHRVPLRRPAAPPPAADARLLVRHALEHPIGFEPLRRALTADDRIAVVFDPSLAQASVILVELLEHLALAGVKPQAVTLLAPPGTPASWSEGMARAFPVVNFEVHDPSARHRLAYLASTQAGRRLYLNRTLIEADFVVVVGPRGYDPLTEYSGAEAAIFPALADEPTRTALAGELTIRLPGPTAGAVRTEAQEVCQLLGTPFLVQVIEGEGDTIQEVLAGLAGSSAEGIRRLNARWQATVEDRPDTVIAALSGDPERLTFLDLARAAAAAYRITTEGGRIAVVTTAAPPLGEGVQLLRRLDDPADVPRELARLNPPDRAAAWLWAAATRQRSLFLASGLADEVVEELFATPAHGPDDIQRLINTGRKVLLLPDAHKTLVSLT